MSNWEQIMITANQKAKQRRTRMAVIGQRWSYAGQRGWHYVVVPAKWRGMLGRGVSVDHG